MKGNRNEAVDALRLSVILLVLLHHSVLAYCRYGHFNREHYLWSSAPIIDQQRWIGFDILQDFNDTYFMSLMFLISGLFVMPGLRRKSAARYVADRFLRLGLPFAICATVLMPLAYYPSILQTGAAPSLGRFWLGYFTTYGWPAGPAWFIWFLLVLDLSCVLLILRWRGLRGWVAAAPDLVVAHPARCLFLFGGAALVAFLPVEAVVGSRRWFSLGPFAVQESRVGLYALFFAAGVAIGAGSIHHRIFRCDGPVARAWTGHALSAATSFALLLLMQLAFLHRVEPFSGPSWQMLDPVLFVPCCVSSSAALGGLFIRHVRRIPAWVARLAGNGYGIYLLHYVVLTWTQFLLLPLSWGAIPKAATVLATTLALSSASTSLLRRSRTLRHVL